LYSPALAGFDYPMELPGFDAVRAKVDRNMDDQAKDDRMSQFLNDAAKAVAPPLLAAAVDCVTDRATQSTLDQRLLRLLRPQHSHLAKVAMSHVADPATQSTLDQRMLRLLRPQDGPPTPGGLLEVKLHAAKNDVGRKHLSEVKAAPRAHTRSAQSSRRVATGSARYQHLKLADVTAARAASEKDAKLARSWANFILSSLYFLRNARAKLDLLSQPDTFLAAVLVGRSEVGAGAPAHDAVSRFLYAKSPLAVHPGEILMTWTEECRCAVPMALTFGGPCERARAQSSSSSASEP
jgi:hypothetical protein